MKNLLFSIHKIVLFISMNNAIINFFIMFDKEIYSSIILLIHIIDSSLNRISVFITIYGFIIQRYRKNK